MVNKNNDLVQRILIIGRKYKSSSKGKRIEVGNMMFPSKKRK